MGVYEDMEKVLNGEPLDNLSTSPYGNGKARRLTGRLFNITGYTRQFVNGRWYNRKFMTIENVSVIMRQKEIENLRRMGCYRVDSIECQTIANEQVGKSIKSRRMEFAKQIFAAANSKFVPKAIPAPVRATAQQTIAWEILNDLDDAYLNREPIVKVSDRKAAIKAEQKRMRIISESNVNNVDAMKIFDRKSYGFMFSSEDEGEITNFILDNKLALEDIIIYVNNETYWQLVELEK